MMEIDDLPVAARRLQLLVEPLDLLRHRIGAFEHEEADVRLRREGVIELPLHIEQLVVALFARVVVAERRVELHTGIQERLVRQLELVLKILGALRSVQVVPHEHDELVLEPFTEFYHLLGELVLGPIARAEVTENGELERAVLVRQRHQLLGRTLLRFDGGRPGGEISVATTGTGHDREEQERNEKVLTCAHDDLAGADTALRPAIWRYLGSASSM